MYTYFNQQVLFLDECNGLRGKTAASAQDDHNRRARLFSCDNNQKECKKFCGSHGKKRICEGETIVTNIRGQV